MSEKKRVIKTRNFPKAESYHNESLHSNLQSGKAYSGELTKNINVILDLLYESSDINDIKYYDTKVEKNIKKLRDITSKICKVDPTNDEASENYISYLTELEFKVILIRKSIHSYVDLLDSKNVCESAVLKSNSVVGFPDTYPKLHMPSCKLSSVCNWENKSILRDPCHYSNPDHQHSKSDGFKSVLSDPCYSPLSKHKHSFVLNQNVPLNQQIHFL